MYRKLLLATAAVALMTSAGLAADGQQCTAKFARRRCRSEEAGATHRRQFAGWRDALGEHQSGRESDGEPGARIGADPATDGSSRPEPVKLER